MKLTQPQRAALAYWLPGIIAGGVALCLFLTVGQTSIIRASGMALVITGMTMVLRRWGAGLAVIGALALALSPAFWSQTGGADSLDLPLTAVVVVVSIGFALVFMRLSRYWFLGLLVGAGLFSLIFWSQLSEPGSLRLTTLAVAWLLYLLVDLLFITNPRPDDSPVGPLPRRYIPGILILLVIGVVNTPLFILMLPGVVLGLLLGHVRVAWWYWVCVVLVGLFGVYGIAAQYASSTWWFYPAAQAQSMGLQLPFMLADGWREGVRWVVLVQMVVEQFTVFGVLLGILGLSRLIRWYPPLGTVTMVLYAAYVLFGLVYFGRDSAVLLLPLLMIQVVWMTYAFYTLRQWLQRGRGANSPAAYMVTVLLYALLPLTMLLRIVS